MKGEKGNISARRRGAILRTVVLAAGSLGIFLIGLAVYRGARNPFSIISAIGAIPTGLSTVNLILFLRAMELPREEYEEIERHRGKLLIRYELEMTSYERVWHVGAACALDQEVALYLTDGEADPRAFEAHVREQLALGGYPELGVKAYGAGDLAGFCAHLDRLEEVRASRNIDPEALERAWQPGTTQTPAGILLSISL